MKLHELENALRDGKAIRRTFWSETRSMRSASGELVDDISNGPVQLNLDDLVGDDWTRADGLGRDTADRNEYIARACSTLSQVVIDAMLAPGTTKRVQVDLHPDGKLARGCETFLEMFAGLEMRGEAPPGANAVTFEITWDGEMLSYDARNTPPVMSRRLPDRRDSDSKPGSPGIKSGQVRPGSPGIESGQGESCLQGPPTGGDS